MLYRLLTDAEFADYDVHVHHLVLKNRENRHEAERFAVHGTSPGCANRATGRSRSRRASTITRS
ncbi:MAG: hypothetical protein M5U09_26445 [Gammaproteobacteria bacterium]|nr:hypothetical protein [Gammaproteobacteria bacterium]